MRKLLSVLILISMLMTSIGPVFAQEGDGQVYLPFLSTGQVPSIDVDEPAVDVLEAAAAKYNDKIRKQKEKAEKRINQEDRVAAAERAEAKGFALPDIYDVLAAGAAPQVGAAMSGMTGATPHYFSHPNYANSPLPGNAVAEWNAIAQGILQPAPMPGMPMPMGGVSMSAAFVYLSYMQAAVYNALVAIEGGYAPYNSSLAPSPGASQPAAVAAAAYGVLNAYFPSADLNAKYADSLATIPAGQAKVDGIALGQTAAAEIIALRGGDVLNGNGGYSVPAPGPGIWQPTATMPDGVTPMPPMDPWMRNLQPFLRATPDQYRPAPPPAVDDPAFLADLAEVRDIGGAMSATRTPEQTEVAQFWATNMVIQTQAAYRRVAEQRGLGLLETARLMAMGNMAASDSLIATFDAKYAYSFWRPVQAIRVTDPTWMPLVMTPNFPEYVTGHSSFISAQAEVYTNLFGTDQIEIDLDSSVTGTTRHYVSAAQLRDEVNNARIWGGLHYRSSNALAETIGRQLVADAMGSYFTSTTAAPVGNPLIERANATDYPVAVGELAPVLVVLPTGLPAGTLLNFQTLNQASAGASPFPSAGNTFHAYVLRPTGVANEYTVVLDSGLLTVPALADPAVSEVATFDVPDLAVQAGDLIAFYGQGIPVDTNGGPDILSYPAPTAPVANSNLTLGSAAFPIHSQARTYSFAAQVDTTVATSTLSGGIRKFVDGLPGLTAANANNLGQYIPVAVPDTTTYSGSDYYEIGLVQYREQLHSDLPSTLLRGYVQISTANVPGDQVPLANANLDPNLPDTPVGFNGVTPPHYLGPTIVATKDRPVRIKFYNLLPKGADGNLFIPVDSTVMGSGMTADGHANMDPAMMDPQNPMCSGPMKAMDVAAGNCYADNRATLHLHGGISPWISDGTPHQWITPAGENTPYPQGVSVRPVPDMGDSGDPNDGVMTFYYTNQQSARLMFYHDHAWGITRLNVYAGEAAGYVITDDTEKALVAAGTIPGADSTIPLIVQDKTFVPSAAQLAVSDETWDMARWGGPGNLWLPHVYSPAQNPGDASGVNQFGRWAYGPWFWPPTNSIDYGPVANEYFDPNCNPDLTWCEPPLMPGVPYNSMGMESFNDTPMVNGTPYPTLTVDPKAYRFRILNAANDRFFNLSIYKAVDANGVLCDANNPNPAPESTGVACTEVALNPAEVAAALQDGTVFPTPLAGTEGPSWIAIGTEGGFLPTPVVVPAQPTTWVNDPTVFNAGNVDQHSLLTAPAERHDVIVDFSAYAGQTLILYNDAPAAFPARDPRYDYYTGNGDYRDTGGAPSTLPGYGPNTRTIMQIKVAAATPAPAYNLAALNAAFAHKADGSGVFEKGQHPIIVGQGEYNSAYGTAFPTNGPQNGTVQIFDTSLTFRTLLGATLSINLKPKMIQDEMGEAFEMEYGRMSGFLGVETPNAQAGQQNMILHAYTYPPDEVLDGVELPPGVQVTPIASTDDGTQIWKFTHNGVDTHPIHFHLYDVQLLNRVGWDGIIRKPHPTELGWKDTVRISPLEDTIVAMRPIVPGIPDTWGGLPNSIRLLDPSMPEGMFLHGANTTQREAAGLPIFAFSPSGEPVDVVNHYVNFGWEYVYHCHILSHEEMDMMHAQVVGVAPAAPTGISFVRQGNGNQRRYVVTWMDNSKNETAFVIERRIQGSTGAWNVIATVPSDRLTVGPGKGTRTYNDVIGNTNTLYQYQVYAVNVVGDTWDYSNPAFNNIPPGGGWPTLTLDSRGGSSSVVAAPSNLTASAVVKNKKSATVNLKWTDNSTNEDGFLIQRADNVLFTQGVVNATVTANITAAIQTVTPGKTYYYRVLAFSNTIQSGWSNTATIAVP